MRKLIFIALTTLLAASLFGRSAAERLTPAQRAAKARYYYMEGVRLQAEDKSGEAYEMFRHAYRVDPSYAEAASAYGLGNIYIENDSLTTPDGLLESLSKVKTFVDKYPDDYHESFYYAYIASQLEDNAEAVRVFKRLAERFPEKSSVLLSLSDVYSRMDSSAKVIETLDKYESIEGKSIPISTRKSLYYFAQGDTVSALRESDDYLRSNPSGPEGYIVKGALFQTIGATDSALVCYETAERIAPESGRPKLMLSSLYKMLNDSVKFDEYTYKSLLSEDFDLDQKLGILGDYLRTLISDKSDHARGDHLFEVLDRQYPYEPRVLDLEARYAYEKGDPKGAREIISRAIDLAPDVEDYYGSKMSYQIALDDYAGAVATYRRAEEVIEPGEGLKFIYATAATQTGDFDGAGKVLHSLLEEMIPGAPIYDSLPMNATVKQLDYASLMQASVIYGMLGDLYYQAKDTVKSFGAYENAVRLMPYNFLTLNNYAYFLAESGSDLDKAENLSKQAVEGDPESSTILDTYAYILFLRGRYPEALEYQEKALKNMADSNNPDAEIYQHLGDILYFLDRKDEAMENWKKALEIEPEDETLRQKVESGKYVK